MERHNISQLESKLKEFQSICSDLSNDSETIELLRIIHQPGYTTPAEFAFTLAVTESLITQSRNLVTLRKALLNGAREVQVGRTATA